jgi:hypothetical protein
MGRRRSAGPPPLPKVKEKKVAYTLIRRESPEGEPMYALMDELIGRHHEDIIHARIALAWNHTWKADTDGIKVLGKMRKASDLDRELAPFDFVVMLNKDFWTSAVVKDDQRRALLDHELCHGSIKLDKDGDPVEDSRGRKVYRLRKHDIEEFSAIVERHGTYKRDLERFYAALKVGVKQRDLPLDSEPEPTRTDPAPTSPVSASGQGETTITVEHAGESVTLPFDKFRKLARNLKRDH